MDLRETILSSDDLPKESVDLPEWGVKVWVRSMTAVERDCYDAELVEMKDLPLKDKMKVLRVKLVISCTVNEEGEHVFTEDDAEALGKKSAKVVGRLYDAAQLLNAIGDESVEEIAGNSNTSGKEGSISD